MDSIRQKFILAFILVLTVCCSYAQEPLTKRLFMQTRRISIELPQTAQGEAAASESYDVFWREEDPAPEEGTGDDILKNINLEEVTIVSQKKKMRISEDLGKVNFSFLIKVPKVLIDPRWRIMLTPRVIVGDSVCTLESVVLKGAEFKALQQKQYDEYGAFMAQLVSPEKYNKKFINSAGITRDMESQQHRYFKAARNERDRMLGYEQWKLRWEQDRMKHNINVLRMRKELQQDYQRRAIARRYDWYMRGRDTSNISSYYNSLYEEEALRKKKYRFRGQMSSGDVPARYRDFFLNGTTLEDLQNYNVTGADSLLFASTQFRQKEVARNDYMLNNTGDVKKNMIRFPYEEHVKEEVVTDSTSNWTYLYNVELPIEEGMKTLKVVIEGKVLAIDRSVWSNPQLDTLTYTVTSLADYADSRLLPAQGDLVTWHRGIKALKERRYKAALELLGDFDNMNAAIAYACNGQTQKAVSILAGVAPLPVVNYLKALLYGRLGNYQAAGDCLLQACNEDRRFAFRAESDGEMMKLMGKFYGLLQKIREIQNE